MKIYFVFLPLLAAAFSAARADEPMVKVVFRQEGASVPASSFAALPKTLYRWQATKGRVEEPQNPLQNVQHLFIADGKDGWFIDLISKTGKHRIDPDVDQNFYAPIIPAPDHSKITPVRSFEIGRELAFMESRNVTPKPMTENGTNELIYECEAEGYTLRLYVTAEKSTPVKAEVLQGGKLLVRLIYLEYSSLPADPARFAPPAGVKITEG